MMYVYGKRDLGKLSAWEWLDKYGVSITRQESVRVLTKYYGFTNYNATLYYNEWREEYRYGKNF